MIVCQFCSTNVDAPYFRNLGSGMADRVERHLFVTLNEPEPKWISEVAKADYLSLGISSRLGYPMAILRLAAFLRRRKVELLHTHLFEGALIGIAAARLAGVKAVVVSRHHLDETALLGTRVHLALDAWAMRSGDAVPVPSAATKRFMEEEQGHRKDNVWVIPYGFDFDAMATTDADAARIRAEFGLEDKFVIGCVGRFFKNKGHRFLFEAVRDVVAAHPELRILLLGDGDREMIDALIAENGLEGHVVKAGHRRDVQACMAAMDLMVHPSLSESFGQVVVEAMAVGTPVIVTSVGGVPEIVDDGRTGLVVPPSDSKSLHSALVRMLSEGEFRERLGREGKASVREKFAVSKFVERNWEMYRAVLKPKA